MLDVFIYVIGFFLIAFGVAKHPWLVAAVVLFGVLLAWLFPASPPPARKAEPPRTADGRFPLLNEDWAGEVVLSIDDAEIPELIRRHGARFRNPARYAIDLGGGEYLLYGGDGELLDLCHLG
ncbi:MAG: hypothetical protein AB1768_08760 [Pseudomonadota bacterium]